ncbi:MAG TPA: glycosyltransferase family 2 protein [Vicinamibacterales bacterium]|jgi:glycosyltransferase involved in cell wall biosynthesis
MGIRPNPRVVVIVPCLNEESTVGGVIDAFRLALPDAEVFVIDNGSDDGTAAVADRHGATVLRESRRGKGNAVRRAFREIDADIYVLVDGDATYPAERVRDVIAPVLDDRADVVVGARLDADSRSEFRTVNRFGNRLLLRVVNTVFAAHITDLLSGYRVMTREFVRQVPVLSVGFEVETELSILALERGFRTVEVPIRLASRPEGSRSKIRIWRDGFRILNAILTLFRDYRPLTFFGTLGVLSMLTGLAPGIAVTIEFVERGTVRIPTAVLATGLEIVGFTFALTGIVLGALSRRFRELDCRLDRIQSATEPSGGLANDGRDRSS